MLVGQPVNSLSARVDVDPLLPLGPGRQRGLEQVAQTLPSTPGVDAVAIADVDADGCNDVVAAGTYGTGMVHLGNGAGGFDGGRDLPQLGYQNPATSTRVTMAVGDLTGDGKPEIVIADKRQLGRDGLPQHLHAIRRRCSATPPSASALRRRHHRPRRHRHRPRARAPARPGRDAVSRRDHG